MQKIYEKKYYPELESHIIDGYDTQGNLIVDPAAKKTIDNVLKHKNSVKNRLKILIEQLRERAEKHDDSKLKEPEVSLLIQMDREPNYEYGTPEYFDKMERYKGFFEHHYKNNTHHPDHFDSDIAKGIEGMDLVDLCEYLVDIISYNENLKVATAIDTLNKQKERFGLDEQLTQILKNTLFNYFASTGPFGPWLIVKNEAEN